MKRKLSILTLVVLVLSACGGSPLVSGDIVQTPPPTSDQPGPNLGESECGALGAGGYPVVWASTFWDLGDGLPTPMPRCDDFPDQDLTPIALIPTSSGPLGFDGQQVVFKANHRTGGGHAATFTLLGPDQVESVTFRAATWSLVGGDPVENVESACAGQPTIAVRGTEGCIDSAGWLVWLESDAFMKLIGPSFDDPATFTWIDSWRPAD